MMSAPVVEIPGPERAATDSASRSPVGHSLARHGIWVFVGRLSNVAIAALSTFVVARLLPQAEFGRFSSILAATQLISLVGIFGLDQAVLREVGKTFAGDDPTKFRPLLRSFAHLAMWTLTASALVCTLFLMFVGPTLVKESFTTFALVGTVLFTVVRAAIQMAGETARALDDPLAANLLGGQAGGALGTAGFLVLLWIASASGRVDWGMAMGLYFAASSLPLLLILYRVHRATAQFPQSDAGEVAPVRVRDLVSQAALPLFLISIVAFCSSRADVLLLSFFRDPEEVAIYEAARRLTLLLTIPLAFMNMVVVTSISRLYAAGQKEELQRMLQTTAAIATVPCLIACAAFLWIPEWILRVFYGEQYVVAAPVLRILVPGQLIFVLSGTCGITLMHTSHANIATGTALLSAISFLVLGTLWTYWFGFIGTAWATSFAIGLQNFANWLLAGTIVGIWTHPRLLWKQPAIHSNNLE